MQPLPPKQPAHHPPKATKKVEPPKKAEPPEKEEPPKKAEPPPPKKSTAGDDQTGM